MDASELICMLEQVFYPFPPFSPLGLDLYVGLEDVRGLGIVSGTLLNGPHLI